MLTAAQAMSVVDEGLLCLDRPVIDLIPEFAAAGKRDVTLANLLTHTAGIKRDTANPAERLSPGLTPLDHLARVIRAPGSWPAGTRVEYASSPFWVVAELITRATGVSYIGHLREWLGDTLGVKARYWTLESPPPHYVGAGSDHNAIAEQTRRLGYPAGGIVASVSDLLAFGSAFASSSRGGGRRLLSDDAISDMSRPWTVGLPGRREPDHRGRTTERAIGWAIGGPGSRRPPSVLWHSGVSGTSMWVHQAEGIVAVLLSARWFLPRRFFGELADTIFAGQHRPVTHGRDGP